MVVVVVVRRRRHGLINGKGAIRNIIIPPIYCFSSSFHLYTCCSDDDDNLICIRYYTYHILQPAERKSDGLCSLLNVSRDDEWWIIDLILRFLSSSLLAHLIWNQPLHNLIVRDSIEDNSIHPLYQHYLISLFDSVANLRFLFLYQLPGLILLRLLSTSSQSVSPVSPASQSIFSILLFPHKNPDNTPEEYYYYMRDR